MRVTFVLSRETECKGAQGLKRCFVQVLVIQIWNEQDLSSLHTLEVKEDDFQALKVEQGILVDFGGFPAKIIALLQRCLASCQDDPPR